jgi:hypothetical protein
MAISSGLFKRAIVAAIAIMVMSSSFVVLMTAPSAEAVVATGLNEGDKWALVGERDLTLDYSSINDLFDIGYDESWIRNATMDDAYFHGQTASVMVFEVVDVTADQYVIKVTAAQNLSLSAKFMLNADLVVPGNYIIDWTDGLSENPEGLLNITEADTAPALLGGEGNVAMAANETFLLTVNKLNMTIASMEYEMSYYARAHIVVNNFPNSTAPNTNVTYNYDYINLTEYISCVSDVALDLNITGNATFAPYLQILADSPEEGSDWGVETYVNATFNYNGMFDATGLPEELTSEMFTEDAADWGVTGFPIDLAKIYNPDNTTEPQFNNGTLEITNETMWPDFENFGNATIIDPILGSILVSNIGPSEGLTIQYCSDRQMIVGMTMQLYVNRMISVTLAMESASLTDANKLMATINGQIEGRATYDDLTPRPVTPIDDDTDDNDDTNNNETADTTNKGSTIGVDVTVIIVVIAAALSVMIGYVVGTKRKPKA